MALGIKEIALTFPGWGDGMNSQEPPVKVGEAYRTGRRLQCVSAVDAILKGTSIKRRPGMQALTTQNYGNMRLLDTYLQQDGTDTLITVLASSAYAVDKTSGSITLLYDMDGTGEAWASTYLDKCFVSNGGQNIKIESASYGNAYQLAISPPTAASAAASGSGSLTGVYTLYACYARKVGGVIRLYSTGQSLGTVTASSQNIVVAFPDSTDPQVTTKVIFMSDAGGSTYYYYGEVAQGTATITIADATNKNAALIYDVVAADNTVPPAFTQILAADNRLWGVLGNTVYFSLQAGTVYDLERWGELNYITYPYKVISIHALGNDLYINTPAGIIKQPQFDVSARFEHVEKRYHFKYPRTVAEWSGTLIGLTEDGVRIFDGTKMSAFDVSLDVKPEIDKAYSGSSGGDHMPCGAVYRRSYRTEYHLGYRDLSIGTEHNNRRLVLNLDRFAINADNTVNAPWEIWTAGANYLTVDSDGNIFAGQSNQFSLVYKESATRCADTNIYLADTLETDSVPTVEVKTGTHITSLSAKVRIIDIRLLAQIAAEMTVEAHVVTYPEVSSSKTIEPLTSTEDVPRFGIARFGVARFAPSTPTHRIAKYPRNILGYAHYFIVKQTLEDKNFEVLQMEATGTAIQSRYT